MEKEELIALVDNDIEKAFEALENMQAEDMMHLRADFSNTTQRDDKFNLADQVLDEAYVSKIMALSSNVENLSESELDTLDTLLGNIKSASFIENVSGIREKISKQRQALADIEKQPEAQNDSTGTVQTDNQNTEQETPEQETPEQTQKEFFESVEERYGVDDAHLQPAEIVMRNIDAFAKNSDVKYKSNAALIETEGFREIKDLLKAMSVTDDAGKPLGDTEKSQDIALFMEQVRNETEMFLANTSANPVTPEVFEEEFKTRMQICLVELLSADCTTKANAANASSLFSDLYSDMYHSPEKLSVKRSSLVGWHGAKTQMATKANSKLEPKQGYQSVFKAFKDSIEATDKKLTKKYGKGYSTAKNLIKTIATSATWSLAYGLGAAAGPVGIAAVATVKLAHSSIKMYKDYKKQKAEVKPGEKFRYFSKFENRQKLYGAALTAVGGFFGYTGTGAENLMSVGNLKVTGDVSRAALGGLLALGGAVKSASDAWKNTQGKWYKKLGASAAVLGTSAAAYAAGLLGGRLAGLGHHESKVSATNQTPQGATELHLQQELQIQDPYADAPELHAPYSEDGYETIQAEAQEMQAAAALHEQITNLSSQQEHDLNMLFSRDSKEAAEVLGIKWMHPRDLQQAWDNGTFTDEQKATLLDFAHQRFDEYGNYRDVDGYASAQSMEDRAAAYTASLKEAQNASVAREAPEAIKADLSLGNEVKATNDISNMNLAVFEETYNEALASADVVHTDGGLALDMGGERTVLNVADDKITDFKYLDDGNMMVTRVIDGREQNIVVDDKSIVSMNGGSVSQTQIDNLNAYYEQNHDAPNNPIENAKSIDAQIKSQAHKIAEHQAVETRSNTVDMVRESPEVIKADLSLGNEVKAENDINNMDLVGVPQHEDTENVVTNDGIETIDGGELEPAIITADAPKNNDQEVGRQISMLRGCGRSQPSAVRQTNVDSRMMTSTNTRA